MRKIVRGLINGESKSLKEMSLDGCKINKVYTILKEDDMYVKFNPHTGEPCEKSLDNLILKHWDTVFVEDMGHDWGVYGDRFKYHPHSSDIGETCDILVEFD